MATRWRYHCSRAVLSRGGVRIAINGARILSAVACGRVVAAAAASCRVHRLSVGSGGASAAAIGGTALTVGLKLPLTAASRTIRRCKRALSSSRVAALTVGHYKPSAGSCATAYTCDLTSRGGQAAECDRKTKQGQ